MLQRISERFNASDWFIERGENQNAVAFYSGDGTVSYGELREKVSQAANALKRTKCHPGDRVFLALPDCIDFVTTFFGAIKIGAIAVPFGANTTISELKAAIRDSDPAVVVAELGLAEQLRLQMPELGSKLFVVGIGPEEDSKPFANWSRALAAEAVAATSECTVQTDPAILIYTSGSTGRPKGVLHAHQSMQAASLNFAASTLGIRADDRLYSLSRLSFAFGLGNGMYFPLSVGASAILSRERFRWALFRHNLKALRPTILFGVPVLFSEMLKELDLNGDIDLSSVRMIVSSGERLHPNLFERFRDRTKFELLDGLGMTEMLQTCIANRPGRSRLGSCGELVPGYEATVRNDDGSVAADGIVGSLWLRGPSSLLGYWNRPDHSRKAKDHDGWVATGDRVHRDANGYFFYHGRTDESQKINGLWVSPVDIEELILSIPGVVRTKVLISRDDTEQAKIAAYLVFDNVSEDSKRMTINKLATLLAPHMTPHFVIELDKFPELSNGKIDVNGLRSLTVTRGQTIHLKGNKNKGQVLLRLEGMLCDLLQHRTVDPSINFLDLGGDSLIATRLLSRIQATFQVDISIEDLFQPDATLENLASQIAGFKE
jgi:benzoate-CoA ligase